MKKLFFSALVAVVAVGGALSANAQYAFSENTDSEFNCIEGEATCVSEINGRTVYLANSTTQVTDPASEFEDLSYIPN